MPHPYQLGRDRNSGDSGPRIFWDDTEKRKVAVQSYHLLKSNPDISHLDAVMAAQRKVLKADRIRTVSTFGKFAPWIKPMWDEIESKTKSQAEAAQGAAQLFEPESLPPSDTVQADPVADTSASLPVDQAPENQTVVFADDGRAFQHANGVDIDKAHTQAETQGEPSRKSTVHWRDDEKRTLAHRVHYLVKSFSDMRPLEALRKAQDELPDDRQREINTWGMVEQWLDPMLAQLKIDEQLAELQAKDARETAEREMREQREREEAEEQRIADIVDERVEAQVAARMAEQRPAGLEAIIQLFAYRFAETLVPAMSDAVMKATAMQIASINFGQPAKDEHKLVAPPKDRLPKLCIVGLLNQQAEDVQKAFLGTVEFVFVKSQQEGGGGHGGAGMLTKSATCDLVLAMVDHMGKDVDASAKHLKVPYHRVNGSATACKRFITSWLAGGNSGASAQ